MPFYETLPCTIEAIQFTGANWDELLSFTEGKAQKKIINDIAYICIDTLEGKMLAGEGSYIIRGLQGEYYPCVESVFNKKYKLLEGAINGNN